MRPRLRITSGGGERLKRDWGKQTDLSPLAESWELSCHEAGPSVVASGEWAGRTLAQVLAAHPQFVGTKAEKAGEFPLLIKLIDAAGPLSVQVHPDDDYAERVEHALGKTEMWYVLDAGEGAGIYYGFKRETTLKEMKAAIESNTLTELLNWVPVKKGECFFIPAGTVHAIGAGLLIAEVQQSSNLTYRVYDYGRLGADGQAASPAHRQGAGRYPPRTAANACRPDRAGAKCCWGQRSAVVRLRQVHDRRADGGRDDERQRVQRELCFAADGGGRRNAELPG